MAATKKGSKTIMTGSTGKEKLADLPRISIVDDDASIGQALDWLCRSAGYRVNLYESAEAFLAADDWMETDCLILDVQLPGRSGPQLQSELNAAGSQFPVIVISAFDDENVRTQAIDSGAVEFLRKPLDREWLLEVIQRAIVQRE